MTEPVSKIFSLYKNGTCVRTYIRIRTRTIGAHGRFLMLCKVKDKFVLSDYLFVLYSLGLNFRGLGLSMPDLVG